ncbi:MAG: N-acetyltransferase [Verrucomicrobiaceae bacterium]|nr:N-acetyltransferase [Verrucomicrobiaceae bacterium]
MTWIDCGPEHLEAIRGILNHAIVHTTARYDYLPKTADEMSSWFEGKQHAGLPIIGLADDSGRLVGFGSYGPFRAFAAYKYTVEHSIYVDTEFQGRGFGKQLLDRLIQVAESQGFKTMVGVIDAENAGSIELHKKQGFITCGIIKEAGYKFGRWLDLVICQKQLTGPTHPVEE